MAFTDILLSILEIAAIIPIGFMCIVLFEKDSVFSKNLSLAIYTGFFALLASIGGYLRVAYSANVNTIILAISFPMLFYVLFTIRGNKFKALYMFTSGGAVSSSLRLYGYLLEANIDSNKSFVDIQSWGVLFRWGFTVLVVVLFAIFMNKIRWLINCKEIEKLWKFLWLVPLVFDAANMITVPHNYSLMKEGRIAKIYITVISALALMQLVFHAMLYIIAKTITEKTRLDKKAQMLSIQASQYESLQHHIEATSKLRHDFKHTARTAVTLAQEGKTDDLIKLLSDYSTTTTLSDKRSIFTKNSSLNALICYYYENATKQDILCNWQVSLPESLNIEDIDLFSIIGNLLENAIHASSEEPKENRYINFKADVEENGDVYIITTNGFSGDIKKEHDKYLSTKKDGSGIGIESIKTAVSKYGGISEFYHDQKTFYADIMLKQNSY